MKTGGSGVPYKHRLIHYKNADRTFDLGTIQAFTAVVSTT